MNLEDTPAIREAAQNVVNNLLPAKSAELYKQCYEQFVEWQKLQRTSSISEDTMLVYFDKLSKELKPSSTWSKYSMLKSTVRNFHNVDMAKYSRLTAFLSKNSKGYVPTKSKTLDSKDVEKFLAEAPDDRYLAMKVSFSMPWLERVISITYQTMRHINHINFRLHSFLESLALVDVTN